MSWTHFLLWLGAAYALYYGLNLAYDQLKSPRDASAYDPGEPVLYFPADEPILISDEPAEIFIEETRGVVNPAEDLLSSGQIGSSTAVSLHDIHELARKELIEYKKKIPY